jgi:tetratricopeptide (TPR) repeat protein
MLFLVLLLGATAFFRLTARSPGPDLSMPHPDVEQAQGGEDSTALEWTARGQAYLAQGDIQAASEAWQAALQSGADPVLTYPLLADAHRQLGDLDRLADDLRHLTQSQPTNPAWQYQLGLVEAILQPEAAHAHLARAAQIDPTLAPAVRALEDGLSSSRASTDQAYRFVAAGQALAGIGEWQLAKAAFAGATRMRPDYAEAWAFLGEARRQTGEESLADLEKALELNGRSVSANTLLGLYWQDAGRPDKALEYLEAAARLDQDNPALQTALGSALAQQGDLPSALEHYQRAAGLSPRDPTYQRVLAGFTIQYESRVREVGLPAARAAVLQSPEDPASLDTLAQVYTLLNQPLIAQRFLKRALAADPEYAPARLHLGLVYLLQEQTGAARDQLLLAQQLAPAGSPVEEQARRLLITTQP